MFLPTRYIEWARQHLGKVRLDLASSGMPTVRLARLGWDAGAADDPGAWERLPEAIAKHNGVHPDEAVASLGATHALWLAYVALTSPGDDVLVEEPAYEPLVRIA